MTRPLEDGATIVCTVSSVAGLRNTREVNSICQNMANAIMSLNVILSYSVLCLLGEQVRNQG